MKWRKLDDDELTRHNPFEVDGPDEPSPLAHARYVPLDQSWPIVAIAIWPKENGLILLEIAWKTDQEAWWNSRRGLPLGLAHALAEMLLQIRKDHP